MGFVDSRSIGADDISFTIEKARQAVDEGYTVISGGAQGIDQTSMLEALEYSGQCVGIYL